MGQLQAAQPLAPPQSLVARSRQGPWLNMRGLALNAALAKTRSNVTYVGGMRAG